MWAEQLAKARAAVEAGSFEATRQASTVFLATAALVGLPGGGGNDRRAADEDGPAVVGAAAIFYPRPASKPAPAHVYVELMVSSAPGKGLGALLLRYVEAFAAANAARLGISGGLGLGGQVRLLGVESARAFYGRCGYRDDDDDDDDEGRRQDGMKEEEQQQEDDGRKYRRREMVKELSAAAAAAM
jgi:GNAT superfamily N-acetyltransferase